MAKIKVFHGSDHNIQTPQCLSGKEDNDYGNGFYTTEYEERTRSLISWSITVKLCGKIKSNLSSVKLVPQMAAVK